MNTNHNDLKQEGTSSLNRLGHDISSHLAVIGSFLEVCRTVESGDVFRMCLKNAEMSYREVIDLLRKER